MQKALNFIISRQVKDKAGNYSGWRMKDFEGKVNPIATGWVYEALKMSRFTQIKVPEHCWDGISNYFKSITTIKDGMAIVDPKMDYMPKGSEKYERMPICETIAAYCNLKEHGSYIGYDDYFKSLVHPIVQPQNSFSTDKYKIDYMYWYFMVLTRFHFQTYFEKDLYDVQYTLQRSHDEDKGKCVYGSWDPIGTWGKAGGRVFSTAMNIILDQLYRIARYGVRYNGLVNFGFQGKEKSVKDELTPKQKLAKKNNELEALKDLHD